MGIGGQVAWLPGEYKGAGGGPRGMGPDRPWWRSGVVGGCWPAPPNGGLAAILRKKGFAKSFWCLSRRRATKLGMVLE